jgi:hypothetical protein
MRRVRQRAVILSCVVAAITSTVPAYAGSQAVTTPVAPPIVSVVDIGPLQQNPTVLARDNARSALFHGQTVWVFGDTPMRTTGVDGDNWSDNTVSWTSDLNASNGLTGWHDRLDANGALAEFLPLTAQEKSYNDAHAGNPCQVQPCGAEYALWPGEIVADDAHNRLLIFYGVISRGGDQSGFTVVGSGIATWTPGQPVARPILSPGSPAPTLMFGAKEFGSGNGSVLVGSMLYNYGCFGEWIITHCQVARVPIGQVLDRHAWRYFAGSGVWSPKMADAAVVLDGGAAGTSVTWNPYLHEYLAVYSQNFTNDVMYRVSASPEGPWSDAKLLTTGLTGWQDNSDYAAASHAEVSISGGKTIYVTYVRTTGLLQQDIRQLLVTFA